MTDDTAKKPTLLSSQRVFEGHLYKVRVDQIRLPSGRKTVREVIEHPGAVAILAITEDQQIILVRQFRYAVDGSLLEIPAGTREPDESPVQTAARELIEETGYRATEIQELRTYYSSAGYSDERITLVLATGCKQSTNQLAPDEVDEVTLVPVSEAPSLLEPGPNQARDAKTLIALSMLIGGIIPLSQGT
jgi:ADP-ribose pyrophosphatase